MSEQFEHIDGAALSELRDVMEDEFPLLVETFLHDSVDRVAQIRETLEATDAEAFSRACHSLKGSCVNVGVPRLAEFCKQGELIGKQGDLSAAGQVVQAIENEFQVIQDLLPKAAL